MTDQGSNDPQAEALPATSNTANKGPSSQRPQSSMMREVRVGLSMIAILLATLAVVAYYRINDDIQQANDLKQKRDTAFAKHRAQLSRPNQLSAETATSTAPKSAPGKLVQFETDGPDTTASQIPSEPDESRFTGGTHSATPKVPDLETQISEHGAPPAIDEQLPEQATDAFNSQLNAIPDSAGEPQTAPPVADQGPQFDETEAEPAESLQLTPPDQIQLTPPDGASAPPADDQSDLDNSFPDAPPSASTVDPTSPAWEPSASATAPEGRRLQLAPGQSAPIAEPASGKESGRRFGFLNRDKQKSTNPGANPQATATQPHAADQHHPSANPEVRHHDGDNLFSSEYSTPPASHEPAPVHAQPEAHHSSQHGIEIFHHQSDSYTVGPNDNYWAISKRIYGSGGYFKALYEHNRQQHPHPNKLRAGDVIATPTAKALEQTYPHLCPRPRDPAHPPQAMHQVATQGHVPGGRAYVVEEGDTLFDIARFELGKASRWAEIYDLNRETLGNDFDYLRPGTQLTLPATESSDTITRTPANGYQR